MAYRDGNETSRTDNRNGGHPDTVDAYRVGVVAVQTARASMLATVVLAGLMASGCSDDSKSNDAGKLPGAKPPTINTAICNDPNLSPQAWATVCGDGVKQPTATPAPVDLQFGQPATTAGDTGYGAREAGQLEVTPATVIYPTGEETHTKPERDGYIIIAIKYRNTGSVVAEAADRTSGAGWQYTAADGEQMGNGVALYPSGFGGMFTDPIQPGAFQQGAQTWGIRNNQRGGTLQYTDGAGRVFRWTIPAQDSGPQIAEMKKGL